MTGLQVITPAVYGGTDLPQLNPLWTPVLLPGTKVWYDADSSLATVDANGNVTALSDLISGVVATPLAEGGPVKTAAALNGRAGLTFATKGLTVPAQSGAGAVPRCYYAVLQLTDVTTAATQTLMGNAQSQLDMVSVTTGYPRISGSASASGTAAMTAGQHVIVAYADGTSAGGLKLRLDGTQLATGTPNATDWTTALIVGRYGSGSSIKGAVIGAFGVAMGVQSLTDIQKLEGYLAQRYLAANFLPAAHPYRTVNPRKLS